MNDTEHAGEVLAAAATDVGRVRAHNEDSHLIDTDAQIFLVADGMGGHAAGEVASAVAVKRVHEAWTAINMRRHIEAYAGHGDADARRTLFQSVRQGVMNAHVDIVEQATLDDEKRGMGTTLTGFLMAGGDAVFAHAGDSRAYLVRDQIPILLSEDHTVLARLRAAGMEAPEADPNADAQTRAKSSKWRGVLTNALGIGDMTRVATFAVPMYSGDRFVLTSDGVTEYLSEVELGKIVSEAASPALAARALVDTAVDRGGADNATAVVVKVLEAGLTRVPPEQRDRDAAAIEQCPLFEQLTSQERLRALRITTPREIKAGRDLAPIALGDSVAYLVLEGEVSLPRGLVAGPSGLVYADALVGPGQMPTDFAIVEKHARLLVIRRNDFHELSEEEPDLGVKLYAALARLMAG